MLTKSFIYKLLQHIGMSNYNVNLILVSFIENVYFSIIVVETLIILSHYYCCYHHIDSSDLWAQFLLMLSTEFFGELYSQCTSRLTQTLIELWRRISFWVTSTTVVRHLFPCICTGLIIAVFKVWYHVVAFFVCVFHVDWIANESCCRLCVSWVHT